MTDSNLNVENNVSPEILIPKKEIVLDATVLSTLMACGRLADFRFNLNLISIDGKSNSLETGLVFHKYAETFYKTLTQGFNKSQAHSAGMIAAELYAKGCPVCTNYMVPDNVEKPSCGHRPGEYPGLQNTPEEPDKPYQVGWKWVLDTCQQYYDHYKNDFWVPLEVEKVKGKILYEDEEIRILWKAKFDLIADTNSAILPIDHKTMKQRRMTLSLNNQFIGQCLVQGTRTMIVNKVGFQKSLKPEEKFDRAIVGYSAARLLEWQGTILPYWAYKLLEYSENEYWAPNFTNCENKYGNCPFQEVCTANPDDRERELRNAFMVNPEGDWNPRNEDAD